MPPTFRALTFVAQSIAVGLAVAFIIVIARPELVVRGGAEADFTAPTSYA